MLKTESLPPSFACQISTNINLPIPLRKEYAFLYEDGDIPIGFKLYIKLEKTSDTMPGPTIIIGKEFSYLNSGDIIRLSLIEKSFRVMFRKNANANSFLLTERCNHYCLMCSQPPKNINDDYIVEEILDTIPLIPVSTPEIGFTGGEPTLLGQNFIKILRTAKSYLPETAIHILSNGRKFNDEKFANDYAEIGNDKMMIGIPLYSDISTIHNYIVQSDGAFDETIRGILNLKRYSQNVEIRFVVHKQNFKRLPQFAEFVARNLTFVDHVALMGLEITGFTKANLKDLWIDPFDYQRELSEAVNILNTYKIPMSIYNHQLCLLQDKSIWAFARKSISDWKNDYLPECQNCAALEDCGGLFSFNLEKHSKHIQPLTHGEVSYNS